MPRFSDLVSDALVRSYSALICVFGRLVGGLRRENVGRQRQNVGGAGFLGAEIGLMVGEICGEVVVGRRGSEGRLVALSVKYSTVRVSLR